MNEQWHVDEVTMRRYASGGLGPARVASVDAHVVGCDDCRGLAATVADLPALDRVKAAIDQRLDATPVRWPERLLRRAGMGVVDARIIDASLSLQGSWLLAGIVTLAFAVLATIAGSEPAGFAMFLVVSPLVPLAGVGVAFGPHLDPTYDIAVAAPVSSARIVLLRSGAVLGATLPVIVLLSVLLPGWSSLAFAWLLPALGLTGAALALGTVMSTSRACAWLAGTWLVGASLSFAGAPRTSVEAFVHEFAAFRPAGQLLFATVAGISAVALVARRSSFEVVA